MRKVTLIFSLLICLCSCDYLKEDFFEFIFGLKNISLKRVCSDNPPILDEDGRFIEIYSISQFDLKRISNSISNFQAITKQNSEYSKNYKPFVWKRTPITDNDSVFIFINEKMSKEEYHCFTKSTIKEILHKPKNYYLPLQDNLGRIRLFILDTENAKLYLLTSLLL